VKAKSGRMRKWQKGINNNNKKERKKSGNDGGM
jgi:hypothetical protein